VIGTAIKNKLASMRRPEHTRGMAFILDIPGRREETVRHGD
jgi:hypothetical protein